MKKVFLLLLLAICLFYMIGCTSDYGENQSDASSREMSLPEKHVVNITLDNYKEYITIETNVVARTSSSSSYHYFRGALSYAFYDNVIISYNYHSDSTSGSTTTEETLFLNAGGCGTITTKSSRYGGTSYEISDVSGTVIYWI